jgi:hypothetical protein
MPGGYRMGQRMETKMPGSEFSYLAISVEFLL